MNSPDPVALSLVAFLLALFATFEVYKAKGDAWGIRLFKMTIDLSMAIIGAWIILKIGDLFQ